MMKYGMRVIMRAAGIGVGAVAVVVVGLGLWFVLSHRESVAASSELAEAEFAQLRARFSSQQPLLDADRRFVSDTMAVSPSVPPIRSFHTVIFDTRGGPRLVRMSVPYWFARRLTGRDAEFKWLGQLTFLDDTEFDPEAVRLPLAELERRGPGLVADYRHPSGGQFLSWVE